MKSAIQTNVPVAILFIVLAQPALAEEPDDMRQAMDAYKLHDYKEAVGHLGAAAPLEFNNAMLHYQLANCMVHLRQKESAIREYRIAYALEPKSMIGKYCKQCLFLFGIDAEGNIELTKPSPKEEKEEASAKAKDEAGLASVSKFLSEDERAIAKNLDALIREQPKPGSPHLEKIGTNLFVRNYKEDRAVSKSTIANNSPTEYEQVLSHKILPLSSKGSGSATVTAVQDLSGKSSARERPEQESPVQGKNLHSGNAGVVASKDKAAELHQRTDLGFGDLMARLKNMINQPRSSKGASP